ncbi:Caffeic acid O-methyltransferase [Quillaja saponaria]|uniref:Caffeic acid O-methyltransferase n=1 Tax=Quillaja saponaria TaxID=32244 RepID=A0AAD7L4D7_QUISA|nr:Caffeic acid O-methyltransferase [Quillaja saponaria]
MASKLETNSKILDAKAKQPNPQEGEVMEESFSYAMQLVTSTVLSFALQSAIELGIFDVMAKAGTGVKLSATEIAAKISTKNPEAPTMLGRILRLLASHSVLNCFVIADPHGIGFHGTRAFEYPALEPRVNDVFNKAMINHTTIVMKEVLESYEGFQHINRLVDVCGGLGITLNLITSKYHHIMGINFDLPHVKKHAPSYPGVKHVGGEMFETVPKRRCHFYEEWILHNWSDEHYLKLLKNCYNAIPEEGKAIVMDAVLPIELETSIQCCEEHFPNGCSYDDLNPRRERARQRTIHGLGCRSWI